MKKNKKKALPPLPPMEPLDYAPPVDALLTKGQEGLKLGSGWLDYRQVGLSEADVPELIRMATDERLNWGDSDSTEVWAPVHAWRALAQLRAEAAIEPLIHLFEEQEESDWFNEDMPDVFAHFGARAIPFLTAFLTDEKHPMFTRITAVNCLEKIAAKDRAARPAAVAALVGQLEKFERNEPELNGFIISSLVDLQESDAMPLMERAFAADRVDEWIMGDWEDVRAEFGLPSAKRAGPAFPFTPSPFLDIDPKKRRGFVD